MHVMGILIVIILGSVRTKSSQVYTRGDFTQVRAIWSRGNTLHPARFCYITIMRYPGHVLYRMKQPGYNDDSVGDLQVTSVIDCS